MCEAKDATESRLLQAERVVVSELISDYYIAHRVMRQCEIIDANTSIVSVLKLIIEEGK